MSLFVVVPDVQVVLQSRGGFYQRDVYVYRKQLYAKHGAAFIRLDRHLVGIGNSTSKPEVLWVDFDDPNNTITVPVKCAPKLVVADTEECGK